MSRRCWVFLHFFSLSFFPPQLAQELVERQLAVLDSEEWGSGLLCAGVWPDRVPSALQSTEDSCFSGVQRDGQVLLYCLNTLSLHSKRSEHSAYTTYPH